MLKNCKCLLLFLFLITFHGSVKSQSLYFPPLVGTSWDTISPVTLGWCPDKIDSLTNFLSDKHTRAFIVLKNGKIAIEKYFGTFTVDSIWYWASAGKSLTGFLTGIAQEEGYLNILDPVQNYLGTGWTSCSAADEQQITIRNQLTMTTGFDDNVPDVDCTADTCLQCIVPAGTRWAYHNAPYHLVHDVIDSATGQSINQYTFSKISTTTGMYGAWVDHIFYSSARSMARFGLLIQNHGAWGSDTLLHDANYFQDMLNTSQTYNLSYGYLWWLNGKSSFMVPTSQIVFPGELVPNGPADMVMALGKNDQKIYVVPSQGLVVIRMGDSAGIPLLAISNFDNELWGKLDDALCGTTGIENQNPELTVNVYPNPSNGEITIANNSNDKISLIRIFDETGKCQYENRTNENLISLNLKQGFYLIQVYYTNSLIPVSRKISVLK